MKNSDDALVLLLSAKPVVVANDELPPPRGGCLAASEPGARGVSSAGNGRRAFLNTCFALGMAGIDPAYCAMTNPSIAAVWLQSAEGETRLVHLHHTVADVGDATMYNQLRRTLASHAINPGLRSWMGSLGESLPRGFDAIVEFRQDGESNIGALLDFSEWYEPDEEIAATKGRLSFDQWLLEYRPTGRDDCLMALPLYYLYQHTGVVVPTVRAVPDLWLDGLLQNTRGMLFWSHQWIELVRLISDLSVPAAHRLIRDYQLGRPDADVALNQKRYLATGQSLVQIIDERSPVRGAFGSPDFVVGDWLHGYLLHSSGHVGTMGSG
jgi:hypothetical protein